MLNAFTVEAPTAFQAWVDTLRRQAWVVYAKPPFGGPATVLDYLARYIRYVAINQAGHIVEMQQNPQWPSYSPSASDQMEELLVDRILIDLTRRRLPPT